MIAGAGSRVRAPLCALFAAVLLLASPVGAEEESVAAEGSLGLTAAVASLIYGPLKVVYMAGGIVLGSLTFLWTGGNGDVAGPVFSMAMDGDYVITPEQIVGEEEIDFAGS